jgi:membrane peptidoglycan carboxypeptidase
MIAALIQSPNGFSPNPKDGAAYQGLVFRWKYVLRTMDQTGTLSPQAYAQALKKFPTVVPPPNNTWNGYRGYIMQAVQNELQNTYNYSVQKINTGGLHIVTTVNKNLMNSLYATVASAERLMRRCTPPALLSGQAPAPCKGLPKWVRAGAVLEQVNNGAILAWYGGPNYNKPHCNCQYDNGLQSRNQVGSSFKTYVLATAVSQGMNVQSSILDGDSPLWIPPDSAPTAFAKPGGQAPGPGYYEVVNDESGNNNLGPVHVQTATAASLNTAYTDLWHAVAYDQATGHHPVTDMAKAFGVDVQASGMTGGPNPMQDEAGIALGQASLTVE